MRRGALVVGMVAGLFGGAIVTVMVMMAALTVVNSFRARKRSITTDSTRRSRVGVTAGAVMPLVEALQKGWLGAGRGGCEGGGAGGGG